jgi:hypothetical protein
VFGNHSNKPLQVTVVKKTYSTTFSSEMLALESNNKTCKVKSYPIVYVASELRLTFNWGVIESKNDKLIGKWIKLYCVELPTFWPLPTTR